LAEADCMTGFHAAIEKLELDKVRQRILRYAVSEPGRELLASLDVMTDPDDIKIRLSEVSQMKQLLEVEDELPLAGVHPVRVSLQKSGIEGSILTAREIFQVGSTMGVARTMRSFLSKQRDAHPLLWRSVDLLYVDKVLEFNIERAVDETGAVRANASRELQTIRRSIGDRSDELRRRLEGILRSVSDQGFSQEEIITTREGRMVIPVKVEHKNHVPGFIHSASASGATVFIEPTETLDLNNDIRSLQFQEQREVERILRELTLQIGVHRTDLIRNLDMLAALDALQAKAKYSIEVLGIAPEITVGGPIRLLRARHPVLLIHHGVQGTVPLDLELGNSYSTLLISGPNAGGKSVALKCLGVLVLMAQAGLHIPAGEDSTLRVFRKIFVDIGDEQSIESDLSTFSSHLSHLKEITAGADASSLVLIDEIGTGTDPSEGGAIAAAVLEYLTSRGSLTIATTHHGALKVFAHETPGIQNGAMEFDQATLTPTYRFRAGVPGSSYALEMADRLGFRESLMARAREFLGGAHMRLEALIQELETTAQEHRKELQTARNERSRAAAMAGEYQSKLAALSGELRELKRKALEEAKAIVDQANAVIERNVKEIREHGASREIARAAREEVKSTRELLKAKELDLPPAAENEAAKGITQGSIVTMTGQNDPGEVVSVFADGKWAVVVFGSIKMRIAMTDLSPTKRKLPVACPAGSIMPERSGPVSRELDLRGMTADEAFPLIDKFIDDAILAGLNRIDVIHGKGTGALRKKVTEFLSRHPRVRSFRLGEWNEGGVGATVVELNEE
jgi:DNA mismatch repair protein MutS2